MKASTKALSAADEVAELLRQDIRTGRIAPGTPLRQGELASRYGTSRIPIREALRAIQAEGLVSYEANRGAVVTKPSPQEVLEMLEVRIALETHALALAIPRMIEDEIAEARQILQIYDRAGQPEEWSEMNARFHEAICAPCECDRLNRLIRDNYFHFNRFARASVSGLAGKEQPQQEHYKLLELCEAGNADGAIKLLREHIQKTQKLMRARIRRSGGNR